MFNVADIVVIAIVIIAIFMGYKKGFIKTLFGVLSFFIAIAITFTFYKPVMELIKERTGFEEWLYGYLYEMNLEGKNAEEVRKKIAFLTSDLKLEEFFTPNYMFDYYSTLHHIEPSVIKERKEYLFDKFGINKFAEVKIGELSTGMKQKTSLAVSLCHDPDIIIFDEPTNGLDVLTSKIVTDFLLELKEKGKTIIVSTHIFSLIEKICDRVGIIINGKMVKEDELTSLTKEKKLEDVFFDLYKESVSGE